MRITGGKYGGRKLAGPEKAGLRPTSDRARQALFNILLHHDFDGFAVEGARVLDLFAGTGALGLEALSRAARFCLFVEDDAETRAIIHENVEALHLTGVTKIWRRDARDLGPLGPGAGGPFDLVFLDPPYGKNLLPPALESLRAGGWLAQHALLVAETGANEALDASGYSCIEERVYGAARLRFLKA